MIRRARLFLLVSAIVAAGVIVTNFPLSSLLHIRSAVTAEAARLGGLRTADKVLSAEVHALGHPSTIAAIAREDYGLISPGQHSVVVLPSQASGAGSRNLLANGPVPSADLLPSDAALGPSAAAPPTPGSKVGFWRQVLDRLEFWHSL